MSDSYHGTRGYREDGASRDAAIAERDKGTTSEMMKRVLKEIQQYGGYGMTSAELRGKIYGEHHGRISSAITKLHIAGEIAALRERRGNCSVYVATPHVNGRETRPYKRQSVRLQVEDVLAILDSHRVTMSPRHPGWHCHACQSVFLDYGAAHRHVAEVIVAAQRGETA